MVVKVMIISLIINMILSFSKIICGILGSSKTLVADGIHSFSDLATDVVALIGLKVSAKPPDKTHPYGHGKYEYVFSIFISLMIIVLSFVIFANSFFGDVVVPSKYVLVVLFICLIIKFFLARFISKYGKKYNNKILITSALESKCDVFNSFIAFIFIFFSLFSYKYEIFAYFDILGSLIISIIIFIVGLKCLMQNINSVIGEVEYNNDYISEIYYIVSSINKNILVKDVKLLKYGSYYILLIKLSTNKDYKLRKLYLIQEKIKNEILRKGYYKFINIEFVLK